MALDRPATHPKRRKAPPGKVISNWAFRIAILAAVGLALAWWFWPWERLAATLDDLLVEKTEILALNVSVNGREKRLRPGETLPFHPADDFRVIGLETNLYNDRAIHLYMPGLDVNDLREPIQLVLLLSLEHFQKPRHLEVQAKKGREILARFHFDVAMSVLDWSAKADQAGDIETKIKYSRLALEMEPDNPVMLRKLATYLEQAGDPAEAAETYRKLLELFPKDDEIREILVSVLRRSGDPVAAAGVYEEALGDPPQVEMLRRIMALYEEAGDEERVLRTYRRLIEASSADQAATLLLDLAKRHEEKGRRDQAIEIYLELQGRLPKEEGLWILKKVAFLAIEEEEPAKAVEFFRQALELDPNDRNLVLNLARLHHRLNDVERRLEYLALAVTMDPEDAETHLRLADALIEHGRADQAAAELKKLIEKHPDRTEARLRLIDLLQRSGDKPALIEQYEHLVGQTPDNRVLLYNLGVLYYETENLEQARKTLKEVVRLDPDDRAAHQYLLDIHRRLKNDEEAAMQARELIRLGVVRPEFYVFVQDVYTKTENWSSLAEAAESWTRRYPDNPDFWTAKGLAKEKLNQPAQAAEAYEQLARLGKQPVDHLLKAAELYEKAKIFEKAEGIYERVLSMDKDNPKAREGFPRAKRNALKSQNNR